MEFRLWRWQITMQSPVLIERLVSANVDVSDSLTPMEGAVRDSGRVVLLSTLSDVERYFVDLGWREEE